MKISSNDADILARIFERYMIYAERFMEHGFGNHPESLRNTNVFIETAEDISVITKLYPAFTEGRTLSEGIRDRIESTQLPNPTPINKSSSQLLLPEAPDASF